MAQYDNAIALAKKLITKYGETFTLGTYTTAATPDPAKPWEPGPINRADQTVYGVFLDYMDKYVDGTMIQAGDMMVLMPNNRSDGTALTSTPTPDDLIIRTGFGFQNWSIVNVKPLRPGAQMVMYELQVRL